MKAAVKRLSFGTVGERREAAAEVARLAQSDERTKRLLPELGVVPPLVSMLADGNGRTDSSQARTNSTEALHELARGAHRNKVHIVKAGLLEKLPRIMEDRELSRSPQLAILLLSISSLANTDFPIPTSELLPFLVASLSAADVPADTKLPCLGALRNLSTNLAHVRDVVSTSGAVRALLLLISLDNREEKTAELALSVLGDLAATSAAARKAVEEDETAPRELVEAMTSSSARCQEHATYLVMVLFARGHGVGSRPPLLREKMRGLGVLQALLEVSLLGSPLAQRRAARILQWFKGDGQSRMRAHSGPRMEMEGAALCPRGSDVVAGGDGREAEDRRNAVDRIVKQSLDRNMRSILRRATASVDLTNNVRGDNVKLLATSSSSKSLPCPEVDHVQDQTK